MTDISIISGLKTGNYVEINLLHINVSTLFEPSEVQFAWIRHEDIFGQKTSRYIFLDYNYRQILGIQFHCCIAKRFKTAVAVNKLPNYTRIFENHIAQMCAF